MFQAIIVMRKGITSVIRRVDIDTFDLILKCINERAEGKQIVTMDQHIARPRFPIRKRAGFNLPKTIFRSVKEQTRFYGKRLVFLANPCKFQFIYLVLCHLKSY